MTDVQASETAMKEMPFSRVIEVPAMHDSVNHPSHYTAFGIEVIDLTEHLSFCRGNAIKYLARAGLKNPATELEDLKKARWYIDREIARTEKLNAGKDQS